MEWGPTGKIRLRKAGWFGRKKLVLQLQESIDVPYDFPLSGAVTECRWRDATDADNIVHLSTRGALEMRDMLLAHMGELS
jgi:hypothetical protein